MKMKKSHNIPLNWMYSIIICASQSLLEPPLLYHITLPVSYAVLLVLTFFSFFVAGGSISNIKAAFSFKKDRSYDLWCVCVWERLMSNWLYNLQACMCKWLWSRDHDHVTRQIQVYNLCVRLEVIKFSFFIYFQICM